MTLHPTTSKLAGTAATMVLVFTIVGAVLAPRGAVATLGAESAASTSTSASAVSPVSLLLAGKVATTSCGPPVASVAVRTDQNGEPDCLFNAAPDALFRLHRGRLHQIVELTPATTIGIGVYGASLSPHAARLALSAGLAEPQIFGMPARAGALARAFGVRGQHPAWSPDGNKIAFDRWDRRRGVWRTYTVGLNGGVPRDLGVGAQPAWSPSGRIAFVKVNGLFGHTGLYTVQAVGARAKPLRTEVPWRTSEPEWSPGGGRIAFVVERQGPSRERSVAIFTVEAEGGTARQVTAFVPCLNFGSCIPHLAWSQDGGHLAWSYQYMDTAPSAGPDAYFAIADPRTPLTQDRWTRVARHATVLDWWPSHQAGADEHAGVPPASRESGVFHGRWSARPRMTLEH